VAAFVGGAITLLWGLGTGHGLGGLAPIEGIEAFDRVWWRAVLETVVGAGVLLVAPIAWLWLRSEQPRLGWMLGAALFAVVFGGIAWGLLVGDLNTFHLFFGSIGLALTPVAIAAALVVLDRARTTHRRLLSGVALATLLGQTVLAAAITVAQLQAFGPLDYPPTPVAVLEALRSLPGNAKAAYACSPIENFAPWDASLVSLDAHTGVRMIPMCFMADRPRRVLGRELDPGIESPYFAVAPQSRLWPSPTSTPSEDEIRALLDEYDIDYILVDPAHPDTLLEPGQRVIEVDGVALYVID
jgi:hypothetical protein